MWRPLPTTQTSSKERYPSSSERKQNNPPTAGGAGAFVAPAAHCPALPKGAVPVLTNSIHLLRGGAGAFVAPATHYPDLHRGAAPVFTKPCAGPGSAGAPRVQTAREGPGDWRHQPARIGPEALAGSASRRASWKLACDTRAGGSWTGAQPSGRKLAHPSWSMKSSLLRGRKRKDAPSSREMTAVHGRSKAGWHDLKEHSSWKP